ncbi:MAG: sulfatase-like hydrolase/transferase [Rikenellaceae bacterium]
MKRESTTILYLAIAGGCCTYHCAAQSRGNVLVIVVDDLGKEMMSIYDTPTSIKAPTPNIDRLAQQGVVFDNVWGAPLSAPARAAMLTGRYGHHTGILSLGVTLPTSEQTLFEAMPEEYANGVIGKWHLSTDMNFAPNYGIDHFAGFAREGGVRDYYSWRFTQDGVTSLSNEYITTKITNSAKEWIAKQSSPWLCWVAYNSPHTPLHLPPKEMHTQKKLSGKAEDIEQNPMSYLVAMIESLDYDIGRLLESADEHTTIILIGDNGTEKRLLQSPYSPRHGKGSLYDSGIAIPMVVSGRGVAQSGQRSGTLVSAVDIFPTVMEFAGVNMSSYEDGYSFARMESQRKYNFAEIMNQRLGYMNVVGDGRYKLITRINGTEELYDTESDSLESRNLLQSSLTGGQAAALESLRTELKRLNIPLDSLSSQSNQSTQQNRPSRPNQNRPNQNRQQR